MRRVPVALVQFDSVPEQALRNLESIHRLTRAAVDGGARWVVFHEGTLCDYTPRLAELAEPVPGGPATTQVLRLARQTGAHISFGLSEKADGRYFITQVFASPDGAVYKYRKTWLWREQTDEGYRNEWVRYDPGAGPELFTIDGVTATCFICADGEAPRCIERAAALRPQIVFYPNNRAQLPDVAVFGKRAAQIGAPMLVTNRVGLTWVRTAEGGCVAFDRAGNVIASANRQGREEILHVNVDIEQAVPPAPYE